MNGKTQFRPLAGIVTGLIIGALVAGACADWEDVGMCAYAGPALPTGDPGASVAIGDVVGNAAGVVSELGWSLLPAGTVVEQTAWDGNVLAIYLTLGPVSDDWSLSPDDIELLNELFAQPFAADDAFGGTWVHVRLGQHLAYGTLEDLSVFEARTPSEVLLDPEANIVPGPTGLVVERGAYSQGMRQPTGALSGVVVYASAGHGWTANDTRWYLQRPVLNGMVEDYGNIDQLNYFLNYAYNAGATVVPFRPVGWQPIEIVLDNDDAGVTYTGAWVNSSASKYYEDGDVLGVPYRYSTADATETAVARYEPTITVTDFYPVFCFATASANRTLQTYRVGHSGGVSEVVIDHRETGNGWIWLGTYYLEAGGDNYVEIPNISTDSGVIIADAIRWGCGQGDVVRPGPGTISGYPRDEEAQRYYAESELGDNAVGFSSGIWDLSSYSDGSDNVGAGGRWAAEMNQVPSGGVQVDRWKRVHLEFHTNASSGSARGQICLITTSGSTTYQADYAETLSNEVDADLLIADADFEHSWVDRSSSTYSSAYGAISTNANDNEFDATIVELAFHDNEEDAELLRDGRVRAAMGRACLHGIIRFLHSLPDSEVPLAFLPDTPGNVAVVDLGGGDVQISWEAPNWNGALGDAATGYVVYQSSNGYGFGDPIVLGNVTSTVVSGVGLDETLYFRVAATNAGGESMPSEVVAVRRSSTSTDSVLIVNGFDRLRRQMDPVTTFTHPTEYAGLSMQRPLWRECNSYDYVVQHAEALAAAGYGFDSCANEAIIDQDVSLDAYDAVVWILGVESSEDSTFNATEQLRVEDYLYGGGGLFVTGAELGYDLVGQGTGTNFMQLTLRAGYSADDAGTFDVTPAASGILDGVGAFDFDPANGAAYEVKSPDVLAAGTDAAVCLNYAGGAVAGVQYTGVSYNVVAFGFPFETISSASVRAQVMQQVIAFLLTAEPLLFDYNRDLDVDMQDFFQFSFCYSGPDNDYAAGHACVDVEGETDLDIDLQDFSLLQASFTGAP